jgi:hypothetical protein
VKKRGHGLENKKNDANRIELKMERSFIISSNGLINGLTIHHYSRRISYANITRFIDRKGRSRTIKGISIKRIAIEKREGLQITC